MPSARRRRSPAAGIALVAPSRRRASAAARALGGRWSGERIAPTSLAELLAGPERARILLCPAGHAIDEDLEFLREVIRRVLWPPPDTDLAAAVAGLRGEHPPPLPPPASTTGARARKSALLMEGTVMPRRAGEAIRLQARDWIVESPFHVRLSGSRLRDLAARGVRWFALRPVRLEAVLVYRTGSPDGRGWRGILPAGTKIVTLGRPKRSR